MCLIGSIPKEKGKFTVFHSSVLQAVVCLRSLTESIPEVQGKSTTFYASVFPSSLVSMRASLAVFLRHRENPTFFTPVCSKFWVVSMCLTGSIPKVQGNPNVFHSSVLQVLGCLYVPHWQYS